MKDFFKTTFYNIFVSSKKHNFPDFTAIVVVIKSEKGFLRVQRSKMYLLQIWHFSWWWQIQEFGEECWLLLVYVMTFFTWFFFFFIDKTINLSQCLTHACHIFHHNCFSHRQLSSLGLCFRSWSDLLDLPSKDSIVESFELNIFGLTITIMLYKLQW